MPRTNPKVFFVCHPHREPKYSSYTIGNRVTIPWNVSLPGCSGHCRKFIKRGGLALDVLTQQVIREDLYFWGEYEPPTSAVIMNNARPIAVHDVLYPVRGNSPMIPNAMNTDPYVFGDHFKNICCGIGRKHYIPGDMILFGCYNSKTKLFALDTVMIVEQTVPINTQLNTSQYYKASIEPARGKSFFYRGVNYNTSPRYFSFVPCRTAYTTYSLPQIDLSKLGFVVKKGWRSYVAAGIPFTNKVWHDVVNQVTKSGWLLGVQIDKI